MKEKLIGPQQSAEQRRVQKETVSRYKKVGDIKIATFMPEGEDHYVLVFEGEVKREDEDGNPKIETISETFDLDSDSNHANEAFSRAVKSAQKGLDIFDLTKGRRWIDQFEK